MNDRKLKIAEFIESLDSSELSSSILLGGKKKKKQKTGSRNGTCINEIFDGCNKSVNRNECKNKSGMCEESINHYNCDNNYRPKS